MEPGPTSAAVALRRLAGFDVDVVEERFEDRRLSGDAFDLMHAATARHWVGPAVRDERAAAALRPDGFLALWEAVHVIPYDGGSFFEAIQAIYDEIGEGFPPGARCRDRRSCPTTGSRSKRVACSRRATSPSTTGRPATGEGVVDQVGDPALAGARRWPEIVAGQLSKVVV